MESRLLEAARGAAREAGRVLLDRFGRPTAVETKTSHADLVTEVDRAAERAIADWLARHAGPGHELLGEESFAAGHGGSAADFRACPNLWVVDPLDGTTNYVHGVPFFAVSIAYLRFGEPRLGVIHDPVRGTWYEAVKGRGCTVDGEPARVSGEASLRQSLLATGFQYDAATAERLNLRQFVAAARESRNVRALGSAALALAFVASGRLTGFWELRLAPWDAAAGGLMVLEAGGRVTDLEGRPFSPFEPAIVASNGHIHDALCDLLRRAAGAGLPAPGGAGL